MQYLPDPRDPCYLAEIAEPALMNYTTLVPAELEQDKRVTDLSDLKGASLSSRSWKREPPLCRGGLGVAQGPMCEIKMDL